MIAMNAHDTNVYALREVIKIICPLFVTFATFITLRVSEAAAQCIVIVPVCVCVCLFVGMLPR